MLNPNEVEKRHVTQDQLDALFARNNAQSMAERDARQRAEAWPHEVERVLGACVKRIVNLEAAVAELKASKP